MYEKNNSYCLENCSRLTPSCSKRSTQRDNITEASSLLTANLFFPCIQEKVATVLQCTGKLYRFSRGFPMVYQQESQCSLYHNCLWRSKYSSRVIQKDACAVLIGEYYWGSSQPGAQPLRESKIPQILLSNSDSKSGDHSEFLLQKKLHVSQQCLTEVCTLSLWPPACCIPLLVLECVTMLMLSWLRQAEHCMVLKGFTAEFHRVFLSCLAASRL